MDSNNPRATKRSNRGLRYAIFLIIAGMLVFLSVRIMPLDGRILQEGTLDVAAYVDDFLRDSLPRRVDQATEACALFSRLSSDNDEDWETLGHQPTIGSRYCFLTYGTGIVEEVAESVVVMRLTGATGTCTVRIATEYVFGNEVRDASGIIRLEDFDDLTRFNQVSELINERIRTQVLPPFLEEVQVQDTVFVAGACCINKRLTAIATIELVPIDLKINR